jgi:membrane-bound serine protease (ClpP class)
VIVATVVLLLVMGVALLAAEILVIPGFGLIGLLGIASTVGAGVVAFTQLGPSWGLLALGGGLAVSGLMGWLLPRTSAGREMVLANNQRGMRAGDASLAQLLGQVGEAVTPLRPAGSARVNGRVVDVVTDGIYVEAGAPVRVAKVEGSRVVVEPHLSTGETLRA